MSAQKVDKVSVEGIEVRSSSEKFSDSFWKLWVLLIIPNMKC